MVNFIFVSSGLKSGEIVNPKRICWRRRIKWEPEGCTALRISHEVSSNVHGKVLGVCSRRLPPSIFALVVMPHGIDCHLDVVILVIAFILWRLIY